MSRNVLIDDEDDARILIDDEDDARILIDDEVDAKQTQLSKAVVKIAWKRQGLNLQTKLKICKAVVMTTLLCQRNMDSLL